MDLRIGVVSTGYLARTRRHVIPSAEIVQLPSKEAFLLGEVPDVDMLLTTAEVGAVITMLYPDYSVVRPREMLARIPIVFAMPIDARDLDRLVDTWIELKREDGTIDELHAHWIRGEQLRQQAPRWSVVRNVLAWVD